MVSVLDVAKLITDTVGEISAMKLQKLMFYCAAWNLVWEESCLFDEDFQAWANGPVLPDLYARHKGHFKVSSAFFADGNPDKLTPGQKENVSRVLEFYGEKSAQWLSDLTHQEDPWLNARGDTPTGAASTAIITKAAMHEYYSSL
jgi:uncharacterized phage-associated protein